MKKLSCVSLFLIVWCQLSAAPTIDDVSPSTGPTAGGAFITLTGSSFGDAPTVAVGGRDAAINSASDSRIVFVLPEGEGVEVPVVVRVDGSESAPAYFSYEAPLISGLNPATIPTAGGVPLTVTGSNFGITPSVTVADAATPILSADHGQIVVMSPAGEGRGKSVQVTVGGQASNTGLVDYLPPSIDSVSPEKVPTSGGTSVTVIGSNFGVSPRVRVGEMEIVPSVASHSHVAFNAPSGSGSDAGLRVVAGGQESAPFSFGYSAPVIEAVSPTKLPTAGNVRLTIHGQSFSTSPSVTLGGNQLTLAEEPTHTEVVVHAPEGQGTDHQLRVRAGDQTSVAFLVDYLPPALTSLLLPAELPTSGGAIITINGSNFGVSPGVRVGGQGAEIEASSHSEIAFALPSGAGTAVTVQVSADSQLSNLLTFDYDPPVIDSIQPARASQRGGTTITLIGRNFGTAAEVRLDDLSAEPIEQTHTSLLFEAPAGEESRELRVAVGGQVSPSQMFEYKWQAIVTFERLSHIFDGTSKSVEVSTEPPGLTVAISYEGGAPPVNVGSYEVSAVVEDDEWEAWAEDILVIRGLTFDVWHEEIDWGDRDSSLGADPGGRGISNFLAFALKIDPIGWGRPYQARGSESGGLPAVFLEETPDGKVLALEFMRRREESAPGLRYFVEFATSPREDDWTVADDPGAETVFPIDAIWERVIVRDSVQVKDASRRLARLRVVGVE